MKVCAHTFDLNPGVKVCAHTFDLNPGVKVFVGVIVTFLDIEPRRAGRRRCEVSHVLYLHYLAKIILHTTRTPQVYIPLLAREAYLITIMHSQTDLQSTSIYPKAQYGLLRQQRV